MTETRTKLVESIDLTGDEPVITHESVKENIPLVCLEGAENLPQEVRKPRPMCEICLEEVSKYTCPGCRMKACSLKCVNEHKRRTSCDGTRDSAVFVAKDGFDNFKLLSDYRFLENGTRISDNARRDKKIRPFFVARKDQNLFNAAKRSGVQLQRMNCGMQKWRENASIFVYKLKELLWTVRFTFPDTTITQSVAGKESVAGNESVAESESVLVRRISETTSLRDALSEYIDPTTASAENRIRFAKYVNRSADEPVVVFFMQQYHPGADNSRYTEVGVDCTLKEALVSKAVLEYPVFHVALPSTAEHLRHEKFNKPSSQSASNPHPQTSNPHPQPHNEEEDGELIDPNPPKRWK